MPATTDEPYTVPQLDKLILLALELGFADDVDHWKAMRARVIAAERTRGSKEPGNE
jgi:hypothetical protein